MAAKLNQQDIIFSHPQEQSLQRCPNALLGRLFIQKLGDVRLSKIEVIDQDLPHSYDVIDASRELAKIGIAVDPDEKRPFLGLAGGRAHEFSLLSQHWILKKLLSVPILESAAGAWAMTAPGAAKTTQLAYESSPPRLGG